MRNIAKQILLLSMMVPAVYGMQQNDPYHEFGSSMREHRIPSNIINIDEDKYQWSKILQSYSRSAKSNNGFDKVNNPILNSIIVIDIPGGNLDNKLSFVDSCKQHYNRLMSEINNDIAECSGDINMEELIFSYEVLTQNMHEFVHKCSENMKKAMNNRSNRYKFNRNNLYIRADGLSFMTYMPQS